MSDDQDKLTGAIFGLQTLVIPLSDRFERLEKGIHDTEEWFRVIQDREERTASEVVRLRVEMMDRLDRQQDTLTRMKGDITVETAAVDNTREKFTQIRNDYDQLAHQVSVVHRRLMALEQRLDSREDGP